MRKSKSTLPMKGIHIPRFFIWVHGFCHGKIMHTGSLNPETNIIESGYVTGQIKRFRNACVNRRKKAEEQLSKVWSEADNLLIDYANVTSALNSSGKNQCSLDGNALARYNERAAGKRASYEAERRTILKKLATLANTIRTEYNAANDQMEATAELLASSLACYGHGLLMKPVHNQNIPVINYEDCATKVIGNHEDTWKAIVSILKEVKE